MSRLLTTSCLELLMISIVFFSTNVQAVYQNISGFVPEQHRPAHTLKLFYKKGLIDANISKAPISAVLNELETKTGLKVMVYDPSILNTRLSVTLTQIPLKKTIKIFLEGFSYVYYLSKDKYVIIVLSANPKIDKSDRTFHYGFHSFSQPEDLIPGADKGVTLRRNAISKTVPKSINEFQPISFDNITQENEQLTVEQQQQEFVIQRALNILSSEHQHLYKEAILQLIGINDPRATEVLIEAAFSDTGWISRNQAVDALWQHTVNLQFSDLASIDALKQLTTDSDENISRIAHQAIDEVNQYQQKD